MLIEFIFYTLDDDGDGIDFCHVIKLKGKCAVYPSQSH